MKKYNLVIFDLDGTLMDTSEGIINCHNEVAKILGKNTIESKEYIEKGIIGYPLPKGFKDHYNMNDEEVKEAIEMYKKMYAEKGIYEAELYKGLPELLKKLKENGIKTAVATLKIEKFAKIMLEDCGVSQYFDVIYGADPNCNYLKKDLVCKAIETLNVQKEEAVLIGDSSFDAEGAKTAGVDFIGVSYGLGFQTNDQVKEGYYTDCASSVEKLEEILLK